jgi:hypothetical protein
MQTTRSHPDLLRHVGERRWPGRPDARPNRLVGDAGDRHVARDGSGHKRDAAAGRDKSEGREDARRGFLHNLWRSTPPAETWRGSCHTIGAILLRNMINRPPKDSSDTFLAFGSTSDDGSPATAGSSEICRTVIRGGFSNGSDRNPRFNCPVASRRSSSGR